MKYPTLASFILLAFFLGFRIRVLNKMDQKEKDSYFDRERRANLTRRKPLDRLNFIQIPLDALPLGILADQPAIAACIAAVKELADKKLVNFGGLTNTELKLTYGAPNISLLTEYDGNYLQLICTLQDWAQALYEASERESAETVLAYAVSIGSDISKSYDLLCKIYLEEGKPDQIKILEESARKLPEASQKRILARLDQYDLSQLLN